MTATKSVVWGRFFKGDRAQKGAGEYTRYVEHRPGEDRDREDGKRKFFDRDENGIDGAKVRELWQEQGKRGPVMHELILSPGLNTVDQQEYTREIMDRLGRTKGQELQWYAVEHKNTDHHHIHVLLAGKDAEGRGVRIDRNDHKHIKEWGDRYIEREHKLDRMLDRESDRLVLSHTYDRDRGDALFNSLFSAAHDDKAHEKTQAKTEQPVKDLQPVKEPAKAREWDKERASAELPDENKIYRSNEAYSKYSSLDELKVLDKALQNKEVERATKPEYAQLKTWIKEKERFGEDYHEKQDREKFDKAEREKLDKREKLDREKLDKGKKQNREANRETQEFDKKFREGYEPRKTGDIHRHMGREQRLYELRGRTSEVHANYQMNLSRQRLQQAMERDPENRENYQKELEWLNESYRDSMKDFEKLDLDSLFGGKDRERDDDRDQKKTVKEREPGEDDRTEKKDGKERGEGKEQNRVSDPAREQPVKTEERQQGDERQLEHQTQEPEKETETKETGKTQEQREKEEREEQARKDREEREERDDRGGR